MDNHTGFIATAHMGISSLFLAAILLFGTPAQGQQRSRPNAPYLKAAHSALIAIESDTSAPPDKDSEDIEIATTQTIDLAEEKAVTSEEKSLTEMLREIYQLKRRDNTVSRAYRVLIEVDNSPLESDNFYTRREKDLEISQFADNQAAIIESEQACFQQLEDSLTRHSLDATACSQWIQRAKVSEKNGNKSGE